MPVLHAAKLATSRAFADFDAKAQTRILDRYRCWEVEDYGWWDSIFEDFDKICKAIGVELGHRWYKGEQHEVNTIHFSGFSSQGDGACFTGTYRPRVDALEAVKAHAPEDETLHTIASKLTAANVAFRLQVPGHEDYCCTIRTDSSSYCHSRTMTFEGEFPSAGFDAQCSDLHEVVSRQLRALADWLYRQLEQEYDYLTSDEHLREILSERAFDEDGVII